MVQTMVAGGLGMLLYMILIFYSSITAQEVASEKGTKIMEQHVMSLSPQPMLTQSHGVPLNTASSLPYFHSLVCSLVQGWFQATL